MSMSPDPQSEAGLYYMLGEMRAQLAAIKEDTGETRAVSAELAKRVTALERADLVSKTRVGLISTVGGAMGGTLITVGLRKFGLV